ncbi:MAG: tungsten formylmethanofuran dehydrogenase [Flavobacteriaceae bacterium]|nr:MAG: tungsten formylmethanofuran dehydrogenase [Flavobacteriaceae bacterium]
MTKIEYNIEIKASVQKVYQTMLGLIDKKTYENWTSIFNPTSTYQGNWDKGSKILFVGCDENGKKGGMVSKIVENQTAKFVSILHYGILDGENEITTGEQVEKWAGGHENYTFSESGGITTVKVEIDTIEDYLDYFDQTYPKALEKLKEIVEN